MAKEIVVEKTITINKPARQVFDYLKFTKHQERFSVWNMKDMNKKTTEQGTDGAVGFVYSWDSAIKSVGAGSQEITNIVDGKMIEYLLKFERPMKNTGTSAFIIDPAGDAQATVTWTFRGPIKFPASLFRKSIEKMLGKDIEQSFANLKKLMEK